LNHLRGVAHNCEIYNRPTEKQSSALKDKVTQKITKMENKRNKKDNKKGKK
jgi:hypothetical protein